MNETQEHAHDHDHGHSHVAPNSSNWKSHLPLLIALLILVVMLSLEYGFHFLPSPLASLFIYGLAYLLAGYNVIDLAVRKALRLDFFNEFVLMTVATLGAFAIGAYSEGVAVMVFYAIGEWFQDDAVAKAKRNIKALLDVRPDEVTVLRGGTALRIHAVDVALDELIQVKAGEKVALDGILQSTSGTFNTAAMTGESQPDTKPQGAQVLAGMINLHNLIEVKVSALFKDSKLSRILELVQDATARKSQTQLFISSFAKVYTPVVFFLALMVMVLPALFVSDYVFREWFYRGLVFLVISCPCALVVSIPLGYFGGIGLASKNGILFKGSNFLDVMTKIDTVVMDKTGTLTKGVFKVQRMKHEGVEPEVLLRLTAALEKQSTHPIAQAIVHEAAGKFEEAKVNGVTEIAGMGLKGRVDEQEVLAGNAALLRKFGIAYDPALDEEAETLVLVAVNGRYAGYFLIADELKPDAHTTIEGLKELGIHPVMLSGDKQQVVDKVANSLGIPEAFGGLLPEEKVARVRALKEAGRHLAFVGDGINDAPVVALADVGMAMGGLGSDATIETADVVIQNDQPSKILAAIKIGKLTRQVVWQNIILAMAVKALVLLLGAGGVANLWEAVIADVGVALLAILNAVRISKVMIK